MALGRLVHGRYLAAGLFLAGVDPILVRLPGKSVDVGKVGEVGVLGWSSLAACARYMEWDDSALEGQGSRVSQPLLSWGR